MISLSHFKILFQMLFLVRVTSTEYNWVTLAEGRHVKPNSPPIPHTCQSSQAVGDIERESDTVSAYIAGTLRAMR